MIRKATMDDLKPLAELYKELMIYHNKLDPQKYETPDEMPAKRK